MPKNVRKKHYGLILVIAWIIGIICLRVFVLNYYYVPSQSMYPTLNGKVSGGDYVLGFKHRDIHRGDIITFKAPERWEGENGKTLVKRVIGMPGDTVGTDPATGAVTINGKVLDEPYVKSNLPFKPGVLDCSTEPRSQRCFGPVKVPEGSYWVMGDNRAASADSSNKCRGPQHGECWGPVSADLVESKVWGIIFPVDRQTRFHDPY